MKKIDAHQHFWNYTEAEFSWIEKDSVKRDFGPADFEPARAPVEVVGSVAVQARMCAAENSYLLNIAKADASILAVVGWADWSRPGAVADLQALPDRSKLKGLRLATQGGDPALLQDPVVNQNVAALAQQDLACDLLLSGDQLECYVEFVAQHPQQRFVIDHFAKPAIGPDQFDSIWAQQITRLAAFENVHCKISGLVSEIRGQDWDLNLMDPYWEHVLGAFGPERIFFGSDWPVCLCRISYAEWIQQLERWTSSLTPAQQEAFWSGNATRFYKL